MDAQKKAEKTVLREGKRRSRRGEREDFERNKQRERHPEGIERKRSCQDSFHSSHPPSTSWSRNGRGCSPNHYTQLPSWKVFTVVNKESKEKAVRIKGQITKMCSISVERLQKDDGLCHPCIFQKHLHIFNTQPLLRESFHLHFLWVCLFTPAILSVRPHPGPCSISSGI